MEKLSRAELVALVRRVFKPTESDKALAVCIDLPDALVPDQPAWAARRAMAAEWVELLRSAEEELGLRCALVLYRNAHTNNGDLPPSVWIHAGGDLPAHADALDLAQARPLEEMLAQHSILMVPSQFSATAPLKLLARSIPFRAATMGGFCPEMIPAMRLDYAEINRRVDFLCSKLDAAEGAHILFSHPNGESRLFLDLRFTHSHASGGLQPKAGMVGNLPSGESYIVPFEGSESEASRSEGTLPVQFGEEVVLYRITRNKAIEVLSEGPVSAAESGKLAAEPAYGNLAELGLGVLAAFGIKPIGKVLLDEKLGAHIAFGRSDHFGGRVGPGDFSCAEAVIHIDRVYVPEMQPDVCIRSLELEFTDGSKLAVLRDGQYVVDFAV